MIWSQDCENWNLFQKTPLFLVVLYISKYVSTNFIFGPIGLKFGVGEKTPAPPPTNPSLEKLYESYRSKALKSEELALISQKEGLTANEVKQWLLSRRNQDFEPELDKFSYECWMALYYITLNCLSFYVMPRKPWFWDLRECWTDYPNQKLDIEIAFIYTLSFSFFIMDFLILMRKRYERKDYYAIRIHHFFTVLLMAYTWYMHLTRFGSLVLCLMELATPFPYISRIGWRLKIPALSGITFVVFAITWVLGRVVLLHFWVIRDYVIFRFNSDESSVNNFIVDFCLLVVLSVNAHWTYAIIDKFMKKLRTSNMLTTLKGLSTKLAKRGD